MLQNDFMKYRKNTASGRICLSIKLLRKGLKCVIYHTLFFWHFRDIANVNKVEKRYDLEIKAFGERIKGLREGKGMTQLDLEIASGIDRTEISRIENGSRNLEFFTIVKIAIALEVELSEFFMTF